MKRAVIGFERDEKALGGAAGVWAWATCAARSSVDGAGVGDDGGRAGGSAGDGSRLQAM